MSMQGSQNILFYTYSYTHAHQRHGEKENTPEEELEKVVITTTILCAYM